MQRSPTEDARLWPGAFVLGSPPMRSWFQWAVLMLTLPAVGAQHTFDFSEFHEGETPAGFRSTVTGRGKPGDWKVVLEEVAPLLPPLTPQASPSHASHTVLAQV